MHLDLNLQRYRKKDFYRLWLERSDFAFLVDENVTSRGPRHRALRALFQAKASNNRKEKSRSLLMADLGINGPVQRPFTPSIT